jgi:hypothetical protein
MAKAQEAFNSIDLSDGSPRLFSFRVTAFAECFLSKVGCFSWTRHLALSQIGTLEAN